MYFGLLVSLGGLIYLKYANFFITSILNAFSSPESAFHFETLNIIVPVGISFFTFRAISYLLDIDKGKIEATTSWIVFFNYLSFFPSLLSGPIDKAKGFIPQLEKKRTFDYEKAADGMRQILWGIFKKTVIADNCIGINNQLFTNYAHLPASSLLVGGFLFTVQIYADFSGYSDMAIGLSRLLGFSISKNFDFPFFAQNIAEFWRKWHISLTSWLTEYVFTPLTIAFRDIGNAGLIAAILINFTLIGLWHGPNWTYVLFGFLHGCYFIPLIYKGTVNKKKKSNTKLFIPPIKEALNMLGTFILVMLTFILFRSENLTMALHYYERLFSVSFFSFPIIPFGKIQKLYTFAFILLMFVIEWLNRDKEYGLQLTTIKQKGLRISIYYLIIFAIILFQADRVNQFIYFKF